jgi:hypothetical protein
MAREYNVSAGGITLANQAVTLVFINPSATMGFRVLRMWASQSANNTSNQQRVQWGRQVTAFPTLVSATPSKLKQLDPASGITGNTTGAAGTCGINASAENGGTKTPIGDDAFNVLNGWLWVPTSPSEVIELPAASASGFYLHFPVAAITLTNWAFGVTYAEMG